MKVIDHNIAHLIILYYNNPSNPDRNHSLEQHGVSLEKLNVFYNVIQHLTIDSVLQETRLLSLTKQLQHILPKWKQTFFIKDHIYLENYEFSILTAIYVNDIDVSLYIQDTQLVSTNRPYKHEWIPLCLLPDIQPKITVSAPSSVTLVYRCLPKHLVNKLLKRHVVFTVQRKDFHIYKMQLITL